MGLSIDSLDDFKFRRAEVEEQGVGYAGLPHVVNDLRTPPLTRRSGFG